MKFVRHWDATLVKTILAALIGISIASAHYTWVAPAEAELKVGKPAAIRLCHGHQFPAGEEKLNLNATEAIILDPAGRKTKLNPVVHENDITAAYTPKTAGLHRVVLTQDRGVSSRTPDGVKPGGRDKNPGAAQAFRSYRSAVAYLPAGNTPSIAPKPAGIELEIVGTLNKGAWELQLLRNGKPVPSAPIEVIFAGAASATEAGKTDSTGKLIYRRPNGAATPLLFSTEWKDPAPAGSAYDTVNYSTTLYVTR